MTEKSDPFWFDQSITVVYLPSVKEHGRHAPHSRSDVAILKHVIYPDWKMLPGPFACREYAAYYNGTIPCNCID